MWIGLVTTCLLLSTTGSHENDTAGGGDGKMIQGVDSCGKLK